MQMDLQKKETVVPPLLLPYLIFKVLQLTLKYQRAMNALN